MNDLIELGVPVAVFAAYYVLLILVLRTCGLPLIWWGTVTPEKAAAWKRFGRWQFVAIHGFLSFALPVLLYDGVSRYMDRKFDPYTSRTLPTVG